MAVINKIIHRFIKDRAEYEEGGALFNQIIPYNVQAFSYKLKENGDPENPNDYIIAYVLGTGASTYIQIASGQGVDTQGNPMPELSREFFIDGSIMVGATEEIDGKSGTVPTPVAGDQDKYLKGDGTWSTPIGSVPSPIDQAGKFLSNNGIESIWRPLADVAITGSYNDLTDIPGPAVTVTLRNWLI